MIVKNSKKLKNSYRCKDRRIMEYLTYKCHLPLLSYDETYYYFTNNNALKKCLEEMPLSLKILAFLSK